MRHPLAPHPVMTRRRVACAVSRPTAVRVLRVAAAALGASIAPSGAAKAQATPGVYVRLWGGTQGVEICATGKRQTETYNPLGTEEVRCRFDMEVAVPGQGVTTITTGTAGGVARNSDGFLRAGAAANIRTSGAFPLGGGSMNMNAQAGWRDVLEFRPGSRIPAFAAFFMGVHGAMEATKFDETRSGSSSANLLASLTGYGHSGRSYSDALNHTIYAGSNGLIESQADVMSFLSVRVPIVSRLPGTTVPFLMHMSVSAGVDAPGSLMPLVTSTANFMNTAWLTGVAFYDEDGNDISDLVQYRFQNGTAFVSFSAVPEPGTWVMLGIALLVMGTGARRRTERGNI